MVEAGANEIPEAEILDALDIAHGEIKKLCALQRELAEKVGKEKLDRRGARRSTRRSTRARSRPRTAPRSTRRPQVEDKLEPPGRLQGRRGAGPRSSTPATRGRGRTPSARRGPGGLRQAREGDHPRADRGPEEAPRRARGRRDPRHRHRGRRRSAHARLGAVHARPDAGPQRGRPRHDARGDAPRHARARDGQVLLAPLQLPALLGRGGRVHARSQAPRHRPRRARRAGAGADDPDARRSSRTRSAWSRTSSSPTARPRWPRVCGSSRCR